VEPLAVCLKRLNDRRESARYRLTTLLQSEAPMSSFPEMGLEPSGQHARDAL
jgi:hypothetical protein